MVALWAQALAERELNRLPDAEHHLRAAIAVGEELDDRARVAQLTSALVSIVAARGRSDEALAIADVAIVMPIYAAREKPVEGVSARLIADADKKIEFIDRSNAEIFNELRRRLNPNDIFITMGAGDVHEIAEMLVRGPAA